MNKNKKINKSKIYDLVESRYASTFKNITKLKKRIKYQFKNEHLLIESLTHRSAIIELRSFLMQNMNLGSNSKKLSTKFEIPNNERLEFLGDSVLGLLISDTLLRRIESFPEGDLSKIRASLVNERVLAGIGRKLEIGHCLILGKGESKGGGRNKNSLLADALEAIIGAVYIDGGVQPCHKIIKVLYKEQFSGAIDVLSKLDYKTRLQELSQQLYKETPKYKMISSAGPDHAKIFEVEVSILGQVYSTGNGASKKLASQIAAEKAYKKLSKILAKNSPSKKTNKKAEKK